MLFCLVGDVSEKGGWVEDLKFPTGERKRLE
jgi:hypothetical protein